MAQARTVQELGEALRAFQESRALLTALELGLLPACAEGATAPALAGRLGSDPRATAMLLDALVALGTLEKRQDLYRCTAAGLELGRQQEGFLHLQHLWGTWSTLTDVVRRGSPLCPDLQETEDPGATRAFIAAMAARARTLSPEALRIVAPAGARRMLDVGGGPATFSLAFARACPDLRATVLDLPGVVPIALGHIREAGLEGRVEVRAGDLRTDDLGEGYDLVLVSAICHMLDEAGNRDLLGRCARALAPGGRIALREFILEPDRTAPAFAALFALNMLVGTPRGNAYTEEELSSWLREAGFGDIRREAPDWILARKP